MSRRVITSLALCCLAFALTAGAASAQSSHTLDVVKSGNGYVSGPGIDCGSDCSEQLAEDCYYDAEIGSVICDPATATLTATDANGFAFDHWAGCDGDPALDTCAVSLSADETVTAYFDDVQNPSASLTSPATTAPTGGSINLAATASDNAAVSRVEFYVRNAQVGQDTTAPYGLVLNTAALADGPALIEAMAVDTSGRVSTRSGRTVTIDNTDPTVSITSGPDGGSYASGTTQTWTFTAADAASGVQKVECSVDSGAYGACSGGLASHSVSGAAAGSHTFTVRITDNVGRTASASRSWTITPALSAPVASAAPVISGTAAVRKTLTASTGTWSGSPTQYSYSWQRCDAAGANCAAIGTTDATDDNAYTPVKADAGRTLRVVVLATNAAGTGVSTSAPTAVVTSGGGKGGK